LLFINLNWWGKNGGIARKVYIYYNFSKEQLQIFMKVKDFLEHCKHSVMTMKFDLQNARTHRFKLGYQSGCVEFYFYSRTLLLELLWQYTSEYFSIL